MNTHSAHAPRLFPDSDTLVKARKRLVDIINELNRQFPGYPVEDPDAIPQSSDFWRGPKGISRVCYREDDVKSREWLQEKFREAGCERVWMDSWGNVYAEMGPTDATPIFLRSHTDSVDHGGPLDGILGVMIGVVIAEFMTPEHIPAGYKLVFGSNAAEEMLYGGHYIGSEALSGHMPREWFDTAKSPEGTTLAADMEKMGLMHHFEEIYADMAKVALSIEVHIEQDVQLEKADLPLGLPERISGVRYFHMHIAPKSGGEDPTNLYGLLRPLMEMGHVLEAITPAGTPRPEPSTPGSATRLSLHDLDLPTNAFQVPGALGFQLTITGGGDTLESDLQALCDWIGSVERTKLTLSNADRENDQFTCKIFIEGYAEHEGAPPMDERRDAFRSFCHFRKWFDQLLGEEVSAPAPVSITPTPDTRMTIGLIEVQEGQLYYTVVAKETDVDVLNDLQTSIEATHGRMSTQFPVSTTSEFGGYSDPVKCDPTALDLAEAIAKRENIGIQRMVSMPGHDVTQFPKPLLIFVRNQHGSHNPNETMRSEDLDPALKLVDEILASMHQG